MSLLFGIDFQKSGPDSAEGLTCRGPLYGGKQKHRVILRKLPFLSLNLSGEWAGSTLVKLSLGADSFQARARGP
jgi:hypothetical protein